MVSSPSTAVQQFQQFFNQAVSLEQSILTSLEHAADYAKKLDEARVKLDDALKEAPSVTGTDYGNVTRADLEKQRQQIDDDLRRAYADGDHHINGLPHDPNADGAPGECWCGLDHGSHNFFGLQTCWCGV